MKKRIWVFLFCAVLALLVVGIAMAETDPVNYTITWLDYDETVLAVTEVTEGEIPVYPGETPTRETDADYIYTFYGWDPEPVVATANATYMANYSAQPRPDKCGDSLYWSFDGSLRTLTITGSGDMDDYGALTSTAPWYSYRYQIRTIVFPEELTRIGNYAFYNCSSLKDCSFPDGMTSVGRNAFLNTGWWNAQTDGVIYLDKVLIGYKSFYPQIITVSEGTRVLADYAFYECNSLERVTIPDSVLGIGSNTFCNCTGLLYASIGNGVANIGYGTFYGCSGLTEITIPCSTEIGTISFSGCSNITSIHFTSGTGDWTTSNYSYTPWYLSRQNLEAVFLDEGISDIGINAFAYCKGLSAIKIPDSVTSIGNGAFKNCTGLTNITMSNNIINIGSDAFMSCSALTEITIPDKVKNIGDYAFWGCTGLEEITIPDTIDNIGENAFFNCSGLKLLMMPCSTNTKAFYGCTALEQIRLTKGTGEMADFYVGDVVSTPWYSSRNNSFSITLDEGITRIGDFTFYGCTGLASIVIPSSLANIGEKAFQNCSGLTDVWYHGTRQMRSRITIDSYNSCLSNAEWHYIAINAIDMKTLPNKLSYLEGESLTVTGGKITTYYEYDIVEEEVMTVDMISGFDNTKVGMQTLTVTFEDQTTTFDISVSHSPGEPVRENVIAPTCTEEGHYDEVVYCTVCHEELSRAEKKIPASGHAPGEPVRENVVAATTAAEGRYDEVVYCTVCHAELSRERHSIPKVSAFDGTVTLNPNDVQFNGKTPYVIYNKKAQKPGVIVKDKNGKTLAASKYTVSYRSNVNPGTAYADIKMKDTGATASVWFKIYMPATTSTTVQNVSNGIQISWAKVENAKGYVIYRRAWNLKDAGWTTFERWNNTTQTTWTDTKVYAGTRYQYGIKAYYTDPMDNYNLGIVGPLKTTVRITTRTLNSVTPGSKKLTAKWSGSTVFTGYQVQVATDAKFTKDVKTVTVSKANTYQTAVSGLKAKTHYYVRVRSYHVFDGTTYYGGWSNVLNGKTK